MQPPRTLEQVMAELGSVYDPQVNSLRQQQSAVPQSVDADIKAAEGLKNRAFEDIRLGAHRRGMTYSGVPMGEQAKYSSDVFAPQVLQYQAQGRQRAQSLEDAILGLNERRMTQGRSIFEGERSLAEQQRQFNEQMKFNQAQASRAAANTFNPTLGVKPGQGGLQGATQRKDKGYDFKDQFGNPISAAAYAAATGIPFRQLLSTMANAGDAGAKQALGFVGDNFGYDPKKIGNSQGLYNSLVWGASKQAPAVGQPLSVSMFQPTQASRLAVR